MEGNNKQILEMIKSELLKNTSGEIDENDSIESFHISSLNYIKFLVLTEVKLNIQFNDEELIFNRDTKVGDLVNMILRKCES